MNYVEVIFGKEFQWPKILSFEQTRAVLNALILQCLFVVNTNELNKKLKMRYLKPIFVTVAF